MVKFAYKVGPSKSAQVGIFFPIATLLIFLSLLFKQHSDGIHKFGSCAIDDMYPRPTAPSFMSACGALSTHDIVFSTSHPSELERMITQVDASPFEFFDLISCKLSKSSFAGADNLREYGNSDTSGESNRRRQLASGLMYVASQLLGRHAMTCLSDLDESSLSIYNTEATSAIHSTLKEFKGISYTASEFFPDGGASGSYVNGVLHQDLQYLSFDNSTFHLILSTEVFEHIPFPYEAHKEVYRTLKKGGAHVFTVPFVDSSKTDIQMSKMDPLTRQITHGPGQPPNFLAPMYHGDTIRKEGVLVFNLFGQQMLRELCQIGFYVEARQMYDPKHGIFGTGAIVFIAWKR